MYRILFLCAILPTLAAAQSGFEKSLDDIDSAGRSLVAARCKAPLSSSEEQVQNRHEDNVTDQIHSIRCDGYSLKYYVANSYVPPHDIPMRLTLTKPHKALPIDLNIGVSAANVRSRLGTPDRDTDGKLVYVVGEAAADSITYVVKGNKIIEIDWAWDVD